MWKLHIWVNMAYRTLLNDSLKGQQHVVTRRKVEKLYINYLNTAHAFYKSYFQRLQSLYGMPQIPRINSLLQLEAVKVDEAQSAMVPVGAVQKSFYATLLHLGDLARWRHKARPKPDGLTVALMVGAHSARCVCGNTDLCSTTTLRMISSQRLGLLTTKWASYPPRRMTTCLWCITFTGLWQSSRLMETRFKTSSMSSANCSR